MDISREWGEISRLKISKCYAMPHFLAIKQEICNLLKIPKYLRYHIYCKIDELNYIFLQSKD